MVADQYDHVFILDLVEYQFSFDFGGTFRELCEQLLSIGLFCSGGEAEDD